MGGGRVSEGQGTGEGSAGHVENELPAVEVAEERAWSQSCVECRSVMGMKAVGVCVCGLMAGYTEQRWDRGLQDAMKSKATSSAAGGVGEKPQQACENCWRWPMGRCC